MNERAVARLRDMAGGELEYGVVLGSGLASAFAEDASLAALDYGAFALPLPSAPGHAGVVRAGRVEGKRAAVFCGRYHLYEGYSAREVVSLVELAARAGASTIVVTNAAGGLDRAFTPGDVMIVRDHLNLTGQNPLAVRDVPPGVKERFVDLSAAYAPRLRALAREAARGCGLRTHEGIYAGLLGPSFETPAEVAMLRAFGAHAVGMSTVLETIEARARGCDVLGLSLITNVHDGAATSADDVVDVAGRAAADFARLIRAILREDCA